jgi:pimeloyl-ACP methyl ester carboxylesterase
VLVGHSYGGLGALFAAARCPEATRSLALLEPSAFSLGQRHPAGRALVEEVRRGGHSAGFDAICDELAERIGASRVVVKGAGHEIQFTGPLVNDVLLALWRSPS